MEAKFLSQNRKLHTIMYCKLWTNMPVHLKQWTIPANYDNCGTLLHVRNHGLCFPFNHWEILVSILGKNEFNVSSKRNIIQISKRKRATSWGNIQICTKCLTGHFCSIWFSSQNGEWFFSKINNVLDFFWTQNRTFHVPFSPVLKVQNFWLNGKCPLTMKWYCLTVSHI